jgi:hypothetical protein
MAQAADAEEWRIRLASECGGLSCACRAEPDALVGFGYRIGEARLEPRQSFDRPIFII